MTIGTATTATMNMTPSVYPDEDAVWIVRSCAASREDGRTTGKTVVKIAVTPAARKTDCPRNEDTSPPDRIRVHEYPAATAATTTSDQPSTPPDDWTWTHTTQPTSGRRRTGAQRVASTRARTRTSPSVLRVRKRRPCRIEKHTVPTPPSTAGIVTHANGPPMLSPLASSGRPVVVSASMAPTQKAAMNAPIARHQAQPSTQRWDVPRLPRYSMATARRMR